MKLIYSSSISRVFCLLSLYLYFVFFQIVSYFGYFFPFHLKKLTFYTEILTRKVELWMFFTRFTHEKTPQINFSSKKKYHKSTIFSSTFQLKLLLKCFLQHFFEKFKSKVYNFKICPIFWMQLANSRRYARSVFKQRSPLRTLCVFLTEFLSNTMILGQVIPKS